MTEKNENQEIRRDYIVKLVFVGGSILTITSRATEKEIEDELMDLYKAMKNEKKSVRFGGTLLNPMNLCYAYIDHSNPIEEGK